MFAYLFALPKLVCSSTVLGTLLGMQEDMVSNIHSGSCSNCVLAHTQPPLRVSQEGDCDANSDQQIKTCSKESEITFRTSFHLAVLGTGWEREHRSG